MARGPQLITIYWRDIPAQVNGVPPRTRGEARSAKHQELLLPRFQKAIDRAAMVADITTSSAYVAEWRQVATPTEDDNYVAAAKAEAARLDAAFPIQQLDAFVATGGWDPARPESERVIADAATALEAASTSNPPPTVEFPHSGDPS